MKALTFDNRPAPEKLPAPAPAYLRQIGHGVALVARAMAQSAAAWVSFQFAVTLAPPPHAVSLPTLMLFMLTVSALSHFLGQQIKIRSSLVAACAGVIGPFLAMSSIPMMYAFSADVPPRVVYFFSAWCFLAAGADAAILASIERSPRSPEIAQGRNALLFLGTLAGLMIAGPLTVSVGYFTAGALAAVVGGTSLLLLLLSLYFPEKDRPALIAVAIGVIILSLYAFNAERSRHKLSAKLYHLITP